MIFDSPPFVFTQGLLYWALVILGCSLLALVTGLAVSLATLGAKGPAHTVRTLLTGIRDLTGMSWRRISAIATLTFKEAYHRRAFMIFLVFLLLFMFSGWFLGELDTGSPAADSAPAAQSQQQPQREQGETSRYQAAKVYVSFVMTSIRWLLIPLALLVSCWGLPADIKDRSLHTVVTKPVRRSEVVVGRMLGYASVVTLVLACVGLVFYVWIVRQVPPGAQRQLIARVPVYAVGDDAFYYLDRNGSRSSQGINVGDPWEYRGYVEGLTNSRAIWTFSNLDVDTIRRQGKLRLEQKFEAFRTYKGDINQQVRYSITLVNPAKDLRVKAGTYPVMEFAVGTEEAVVEIPFQLTYRDSYEIDAEEKTADLFDDLMDKNSLVVEVACEDAQQFVGVAQNDLFIRLPDRSFVVGYAKAMLGLWLMLMLVVALGTSASCFLKGPVATMLTLSLIILGQGLRSFMQEQLDQLATQESGPLGGGPLEATYRLVTQMNVQVPLPENAGTTLIKWLDLRVFDGLRLVQNIIPNFTFYDMNKFVANGFDVSWDRALLPCLATTIGYILPLIVLGYFSLQLRELEHK